MKYCKKCHILYSSFAAACPKCGIAAASPQREEGSADRRAVRSDWLRIALGIPALIGLIYLAALLIKTFG